jgi:hypothetical protein
MNSRLSFALLLVSCLLPFWLFAAAAKLQPTATPVPTAALVPTMTPLPTVVPVAAKPPANVNNSKALAIHKPLLNPSWGKVAQYRREQNFTLTDKSWETLHEFVMQDDNGIVRIATYHESASGEGYWEVWVWDRP